MTTVSCLLQNNRFCADGCNTIYRLSSVPRVVAFRRRGDKTVNCKLVGKRRTITIERPVWFETDNSVYEHHYHICTDLKTTVLISLIIKG